MRDMKSSGGTKWRWSFQILGVSFGSCYSWRENFAVAVMMLLVFLSVVAGLFVGLSFITDLFYNAVDVTMTNNAAAAAKTISRMAQN